MRLGFNGRFLSAAPGGVQRFALEVLRRLVSATEVVLFLPRGVDVPEDLPAPARIDTGRLRGPAWEQLELPIRRRRAGADLVLHPANAAPLWGGPHVVVLHDLAPLSEPEAFRLRYRLWARTAHARAAARAAAVVSVSDWSAREIERLLSLPSGHVTVARQGVAPLDAPAAPCEVEEVRRRLDLPDRYFLATTGGDPRKGEAFLREVWRTWPGGDPPALVIVGNHFARVHAANGRAPLQGVTVLGYVPDADLRALYTGAVGLLYPSRFEGFGRPPLEALACGTRVLATPYGPAAEVLDGACEIVRADVRAWQRALAALLCEDGEVRAARLEEGRAAAATFEWDDAVSGILDVCRRVVEEAR
jgi:glycosyltransferase involved in cell wall biosynthesis